MYQMYWDLSKFVYVAIYAHFADSMVFKHNRNDENIWHPTVVSLLTVNNFQRPILSITAYTILDGNKFKSTTSF